MHHIGSSLAGSYAKGSARSGEKLTQDCAWCPHRLETYGKLIGALLVLHKLEDWRNESPEQHQRIFQRIAFQVLDELDFDRAVSAELPDEPFFQTPLRERVLADRRCFLSALVALYKGRPPPF